MPTYTVRLYGIGANPLRTEQLAAQDAGAAASWASDKVRTSQTFTGARIYDGDAVAREVGFRRSSVV